MDWEMDNRGNINPVDKYGQNNAPARDAPQRDSGPNNYDQKGWEAQGSDPGRKQEANYASAHAADNPFDQSRNSPARAQNQNQGQQGQGAGGYQRQDNNQNGGYQNRQQGNGGGGQQGGYQQRSNGGYQGGGGGGGNGGYQQRQGGGGGYQGRQGGGGRGGFQPKVWTPEELAAAQIYKTIVITGNDGQPPTVDNTIQRIVQAIQEAGFTVRSGGMKGVEDTVERFARQIEVHLPWKGFDQKESKFTYSSDEAKEYARRHHPAWDGLKPGIQAFFTKNVRLILGKDLKSPTQALIIWSEDGAETTRERTSRTGSAGHSLSLASELRIPIFNLQRPDAEQRIMQFLQGQG